MQGQDGLVLEDAEELDVGLVGRHHELSHVVFESDPVYLTRGSW